MNKKIICLLLTVSLSFLSVIGYPFSVKANDNLDIDSKYNNPIDTNSLIFDNSLWHYDIENNVYWQIGVIYCATPESTDYESLGIYVPGNYMNAIDNGNGTYTCSINTSNNINGYTAQTAPIVMPINTGGYSAQLAPKQYSYNGLSSYLNSGFIYVYAGCRGRDNGYDDNGNLVFNGGAPWGITDLKSAVRYLRYNTDILPGDTDKIFTFGHSGGGALSSLMGVTGDSELYFDYLNSIGALMNDKDGNYISDSIMGAMSWCPITSLDYANEAYEWMMGQYFSTGTRSKDTWTSLLSDDLSKAFAQYINELGLINENGTSLTLTSSENGIYTSGSYYEYIVSEIECSLNNFLNDTEFPYTSGNERFMVDGGFTGGTAINERLNIQKPDDINTDTINKPKQNNEFETYETIQDYIDYLNKDTEWVKYDKESNTAKILSIEAFVTCCKNASKNVGAFDDLNRSKAENLVFGDNQNNALHFDSIMAELLKENQEQYAQYSDWNEIYVEAYQEYLNSTDILGKTSIQRQNMYNPMYFISEYYEGYDTSTVAPYWRIHTGITQGDTSLTVEMNLALALEQYDSVKNVDFETVWAQGHTTAERTGNSTDNFISWINECLSK